MKRTVLAFTIALLASVVKAAGISKMMVEYESNPLGIDTEHPRFSWQMATNTSQHGQRQTAWRIVVRNNNGMVMWDSGKTMSAKSLGIEYMGARLLPETPYTWELTAWDERGRSETSVSTFETGLMHSHNWDGARWIGSSSSELPLYSQYLPVFTLEYTVQLNRNNHSKRASIIYGANDMRLTDRNKNLLGIAAKHDESFVRMELDISSDTARIHFYRSHYRQNDHTNTPLKSFDIPTAIISNSNRYDAHRIRLTSVLGTTCVFIDNADKPVAQIELNPIGKGGDFTAFPVLANVGFLTAKGQTARFSDLRVRNFRSPSNTIKVLVKDTLVNDIDEVKTFDPDGNSEPMLRTVFNADSNIARARLYVTARGTYQMYINGKSVGSDYLNPGLTQYNKTHIYHVYDVTKHIHSGRNAMGAQLAEGWWRGGATYIGENWNPFGDRSSLLAKLVITYADGHTTRVVSEPDTWQCLDSGPLRSGSLFQGEVYDGCRSAELTGWSEPNFDAAEWETAAEIPTDGNVCATGNDAQPRVDDFSELELVSLPGNTIHAIDTLTAISVKEVRPGVFVYDMGQNMTGVPDIAFRNLRPGTEIKMRFAEVLYPQLRKYKDNAGMIMLENIRAAMAQDIYTAHGGEETFSPHFTYHGYRYVELTGIDKALPLQDVRSHVISSVRDFTADYKCSNDTVNRLWKNTKWSMLANFMSVPTDCPQRNERMGWSGDISVFSPAAVHLARIPQFLRLHTIAMRNVQTSEGRFPDIAPIGGGFGGILWGSAGIVVPWQDYVQFGDRDVLRDNYKAMCRYINFIRDKTIDPTTGIIVQQRAWGDLGDWLGPEDGLNDKSLLWEAYYIHDLDIMRKIAAILGQADDEAHFARIASERRSFFNVTYINHSTAKTIWSVFSKEKKGQSIDTQTSYILPLAFDIVTDSLRQRFADNLIRAVSLPRNGFKPYSLLTGFIGTAWISNTLSDIGRPDIAYRLLLNDNYPSWLYPVTQGATTVWERLNSYTHEYGFGSNNRMNSFNHYSFGAVSHWLVSHSLGIERDESSPGFSRFTLRPEPDTTGKLSYAEGYYDSMYGRIESSWRIGSDGTTTYELTVPANTTAMLHLKGKRIKGIGKGAKLCKHSNGQFAIELESGKYRFVVK